MLSDIEVLDANDRTVRSFVMVHVAWLVAQALYLFAPLLLSAALSAVVLKFELVRWLKRPIDGGAHFRGRRVFGDGKTWRGVAVAVFGSIVGVLIQRYVLVDLAAPLARVDYRHISPLAFGAAMGLGAMTGELPNSFVKRQVGIASGGTTRGPLSVLFYLWDQVDLLTLTWPTLCVWMRPSIGLVIASFAVAVTVHPLVSLIGFALGARKTAR